MRNDTFNKRHAALSCQLLRTSACGLEVNYEPHPQSHSRWCHKLKRFAPFLLQTSSISFAIRCVVRVDEPLGSNDSCQPRALASPAAPGPPARGPAGPLPSQPHHQPFTQKRKLIKHGLETNLPNAFHGTTGSQVYCQAVN